MKIILHFQHLHISNKTAFSKGYIEIYRIIELQKKQNWIKANKLILNSRLAFIPQMQKIARKPWILTKSQSGEAESSM